MGHGEKRSYYCCIDPRTIVSLSVATLALIAALSFVTGWFGSKAASRPPSDTLVNKTGRTVLVISLDGVRADYLDRGLTPALKGLGV
jgi:hypothetical protein